MDINSITKEDFNKVINKHKPNLFTKIMFKFFSKEDYNNKLSLSNIFTYVMIVIYFLGALGNFSKVMSYSMGFFTLLYTSLLIGLGVCIYIAKIINNVRIKKIINELNIGESAYYKLLNKYGT
jgi:hypothetical protein